MREILFRGKRADNDEWVYGDLLHPDLYGNGYSIEDFTKEKNNCFDVSPETVGQFTGLTDKNGNKIFEGDVVKIYLYDPKGLANYEIGCIKCDDTKARFVFCTEEGNYGIDNSNVFEVIGNIYDNPELLKGGTE